MLIACAAPGPGLDPAPDLDCVVGGGFASRRHLEAIAAVRQAVEGGPLFMIPAAGADVHCRADIDTGAIWIEYRFRKGESLRVEHDPRLDYTSQHARLFLAKGEDPVGVLRQTEQVAFGAEGCGIDWDQPEIRAGEVPDERDTVFRGDICHCQARVSRDAAGHPVRFLFRRAC